MFLRHKKCNPLLTLLLAMLGLKWFKKVKGMNESERTYYRQKRKLFKEKMCDAFSVFDDRVDDDVADHEEAK